MFFVSTVFPFVCASMSPILNQFCLLSNVIGRMEEWITLKKKRMNEKITKYSSFDDWKPAARCEFVLTSFLVKTLLIRRFFLFGLFYNVRVVDILKTVFTAQIGVRSHTAEEHELVWRTEKQINPIPYHVLNIKTRNVISLRGCRTTAEIEQRQHERRDRKKNSTNMQSYGKWRPPDFDLSIRVLGMETRNQKKKNKNWFRW